VKKKGFYQNLVSGFTSKGFCIANFELFFMVLATFIGQKQWLKNNLGTHNSSNFNFLA
jgi:hypothetical protein